MDPARLEALFDAALDLPPEEQAGYLARACPDDDDLRAEVLALLAADQLPVDERAVRESGALQIASQNGDANGDAALGEQGWRDALPAIGERIRQYEIIREIGRGGMGVVMLARDTKLARRVAIKFLCRANRPAGRQSLDRFLTEARVTARCTHENIVIIHEVDEYRGTPYMVLEYVEGQSLGRILGGARVPHERALELIIPVVRALAYAHDRGIVHRDLKPDNILVTHAGTIKVLDFGIAKLHTSERENMSSGAIGPGSIASLDASDESLALTTRRDASTRPGAILGTMPYMSPEQWRDASYVDHRTDIWAIGIMLYQMLAGHHPLRPRRVEDLVVTRDLSLPMPTLRGSGAPVPEALADVIDRCLEKDPDARIGSAHELLAGLEAFSPRTPGRRLAQDESPYPGLLYFREADADRYVGRSRDIANILARMRERALVGVVGPTGIGKSSFVRAGVTPALRASGEAWESYLIRPGPRPFAALAGSLAPLVTTRGSDVDTDRDHVLARAGDGSGLAHRLEREPGYLGSLLRKRARSHRTNVLLIVDPFEELYTMVADPAERDAFIASLCGAADDVGTPVRVMISMRSDFLDRLAEHQPFMNQLTAGLVFLAPPSRDGLREALTHPAALAGYRFENDAMVERILDDVAGTSGSLPLLQFAAAELWHGRDRERRVLTQARYRQIGGVEGALSRHADQVVQAVQRTSPRAPELVRALLRRLVTKDRTRAMVPRADLEDLADAPEVVSTILEQLVDARLLVVHDDEARAGATVELIHDSLIHSWPKLARWLDESADDAAFVEELGAAARQWQAKGRPQGLLWRGEAAEQARLWHRRYRGPLSRLEQSYLHATFALAARAQRIKRWLIVGTMSLLALLTTAAAVALLMIRDAEREATQQAESAEDARHELEIQLENLRRATEERRQAENLADNLGLQARETGQELDRTVEELRASVAALEEAKARAESESAKARVLQRQAEGARNLAQEEAERARAAAEEARAANEALSRKLDEERERLRQLEGKAGRINRTLK